MNNKDNSTTPDAPAVIMLPPMLVLLHMVLGLFLNWAFNLFLPFSFGHVWGWLGVVLLAAAFGITKWSKDLFEAAGTNVPPNKPALVIVTKGPYRFTRNPMYVSFLLGFMGTSLLADAPIMLLLTFSLFYILNYHVIVPEEKYLGEKFGDTYLEYKKTARRWV